MNAELIEEIEAFLEGQISREELQKEATSLGVEDLEAEIQWFQNSRTAIGAAGLRAQLKEVLPQAQREETKVRRLRPIRTILAIAASVLVIVLAAYWGLNQDNRPGLYAQYEYIDPGLPVVMSQSENYQLYDALTYYSEENYALASEKLIQIQVQYPDNDTLSYYLGASLLYQGETAAAQQTLRRVLEKKDSPFRQRAEWLSVLAALRDKDRKKAKRLLQNVMDNPWPRILQRGGKFTKGINRMKVSRWNAYWFWVGLWLLPAMAKAQPTKEALLDRGVYHFERGQADSALYYYQQAYEKPSPGLKLKALAGLINLALLQSDMAGADSLVQLGDRIIEKAAVEPTAQFEFKTSKGEYFRKNSQLDKALQQQREVMLMSEGIKEAALPRAYALFYAALTFERLAAYDSSLLYVNRAYRIFQEQLDSSELKFRTIYNGLGACYFRANRLAEAKGFFLKSKAIAEKKLGPISRDLAVCLNNLSAVSRTEENYREAITYGEQALKIYRALEDESGAAGAYYSLGIYHYYMGDYGRAKNYIEACIAIRERLYGNGHFSLIGPYELLGIAYEESGDYEKTLSYLRKGRETIAANYERGSLPQGFNYENTAICFQSIGQLDSALHYIRLANAILPRQLPRNDYSLGVHYFSYANILYQLNELDKAASMLRQSNLISEALGMDNSSEYAQNLALQGWMYAEEKKWKPADANFELALSKIRLPGETGASGPSFQLAPNTLELLNEYTRYLFQKYQSTADKEALQLFETYSQTYLQLSDKFRKQFIDPYTKSVLIKDNAEVYSRNIGIYNQLYRKTQKEAYLKAAYQFSEYGRACLLRDLQDDNKISAYAGLPDSILQRELALKKKITALNQQLLENPDSAPVKEKLFASKEALNAHIENTLQHYPEYYDLKFNATVPALENIQARLEAGHNLIEYMQDDTAYYALLIHTEKRELFYLGNRQLIDEAIRKWRQMIMARDGQALNTTGQWLYQKIWQPLEEHLSGNRVTIMPVGPLYYLNFETLPKGSSAAPFLIYDYNISYALSLSVLFSNAGKHEKGPLLAVAPGFEDAIKRAYQSKLDTLEPLDEEYLRTVRQPWSLKLASLLKEKFALQAYTGLDATEANVKANIHRGKVLYFGTHAIADPSDPLRSKLVLAKEIGQQKEDGYLHAYELYGLPLQAELAVLSACESGLGRLQKGEGMISLAYSIHYAGCPSTAMSLWKVDEKINTQITAYFLDYLSQGYSTSEALRQAKLDYLDSADPRLKHPFFWGGMVLMGKDGLAPLEKRTRRWPLVLGLGILMALFVYGQFRKKQLT